MKVLLALQLLSTLGMTGLIWMVQLVHYPLFAQVGEDSFPSYAREHSRRITWIVAPLMGLELVTAYLLWRLAPDPVTLTGLSLVVLLWLTTGLFFVPLHSRLAQRFETGLHRYLVAGNWVRTLLWSLRSLLLLCWFLGK